MLPTAAHLDRLASPDSCRAVEVEETSAAIARGLLDHKMPVQHDRLQTCQQIVRTVDVGPTHLGAADSSVGEVMDELAQEIRLRHKIGVEDRNQLALRRLHPILQRARFKAGAIVAMKVRNVETCARVVLDRRPRNVHGFVNRVIQHLDLQKFARIINLGHCPDQAFHDVHFVE